MIKMLSKKMLKNVSILLLTLLLFSIIPITGPIAFPVANATTQNGEKIIVSMGDSYSSGEGIDNFYDYNLPLEEKIKSEDWLAHRSEESWPGRLTLPGVKGTMAENRNKNWYFVASSGAKTKHISGTQNKTYYKEDRDGTLYTDTVSLPAQIDIFKKLADEGKSADYVTITIGGNDMGFGGIIEQAAKGSSYLNPNGLSDKLFEKIEDTTFIDTLVQTYKSIREASGAKIIVAGYPTLLDDSGFLIDKYEAQMINNCVNIFNNRIHMAVIRAEMDDGINGNYHYVSVEDKFLGHEAYSDDPYLRGIEFPAKPQDIDSRKISSDYSMHPNNMGAKIYAECVQAKINELERVTSEERDIVLVLDTSGSMSGTPISETREAATKFINTVLQEDASIGIVTYDDYAEMVSDFSMNEEYLTQIASGLRSGGGTNMESGLRKAQEMLTVSNAKKKIIVLMSDGEPNVGLQGDDLISYANTIKNEGTYLYTLGFFDSVGSSKSSAQDLMQRMASDGCHYEVSNAEDLVYFFGDIADQINGQKYIYVRIACPVDVEVSYDGETLSSTDNDAKNRTSFGSITYEESTKEYEDSTDNRIKILRLKDNNKYDIHIEGNGKGSMDYTIGFMDANGEYSDLREFNNIKINKRTEIDTVAANNSTTTLKVDEDGDGKYDLTYKAKSNSEGKLVDYTLLIYIAVGILIIIAIITFCLFIKKWKKQREISIKNKKAMEIKFCTSCGNKVSGDTTFCGKCGNRVD